MKFQLAKIQRKQKIAPESRLFIKRRQLKKQAKGYLTKLWIFLSILLVTFSAFAVYKKWPQELQEKTIKYFHHSAKRLGLRLENIQVTGRVNTPKFIIKQALTLKQNDSLYKQDLDICQEKIEQNPWVKRAIVSRILPSTIRISITERRPIAFWKHKSKLYLIDADGEYIPIKNKNKFGDLLDVYGHGAPKNFPKLLKALDSLPETKNAITSANRIRNHRWNLNLKSGTVVKLRGNYSQNLSLLQKLITKHDLLNKPLKYIDLRDRGRIWFSIK